MRCLVAWLLVGQVVERCVDAGCCVEEGESKRIAGGPVPASRRETLRIVNGACVYVVDARRDLRRGRLEDAVGLSAEMEKRAAQCPCSETGRLSAVWPSPWATMQMRVADNRAFDLTRDTHSPTLIASSPRVPAGCLGPARI